MSLVIYVSQKTVIISKYNLEFRFNPPPLKLTQAAIGAYQILRQSKVLQSESSRDQKEEAITLLKHYGEALYHSVIPEQVRSSVYKAGGLFIYCLEQSIIDLPWELLFDGSSFFALTQGVIRINKSEAGIFNEASDYMFPSLRLSLNSYIPYDQQQVVPGFSAHVEELGATAVPRSPLIELDVNGNANRDQILEALNQSPNLFLFSGYDSSYGWILDSQGKEVNSQGWMEAQLKPRLKEAVKNGLKIVILQTSSLLENPPTSQNNPVRFIFDCGVPFVIAVHGRLARIRLKEYFHIFLLNLIREENISRAHRLAINHIQSSLPLSWDWSWIRFHINQKLLESTTEQPLPPFHFNRSPQQNFKTDESAYRYKNSLHERRFYGNPEILKEWIERLNHGDTQEILCLNAAKGQPVETYLGEWLRRTIPGISIDLSVLYYQRWGQNPETRNRLQSSKFSNLFSFLTNDRQLESHFEKSLVCQNISSNQNAPLSVIFVYDPPAKPDHQFDQWLEQQQEQGKKIVFIHDHLYTTRHKTLDFNLGNTDQYQIINCFEDGLPEQWIELVESDLPDCMKDVQLLTIIYKLGEKDLIEFPRQSPSLLQLYQACFQTLISGLSASRLKIFTSLYLMGIACPKTVLVDLIEPSSLDQDLAYLLDSHLIETNLISDCFWLPVQLRYRLQQQELISKTILQRQGRELLQHLIAYQNINLILLRYVETGFQNCLLKLVELGDIEYSLQRNLQFGKKLARRFQTATRFSQNILTSLELALEVKKGELIQKTMFSLIEILEELPFEKETIIICDWLLKIETKHRNWPLVSELQTRMASIYAKIDKKEKAIGLISSAIKLNNDINNFSSRYKNLISIALLLLDLDEYEKLGKLLTTANFDMSLLNKEDIARLWLIDGHMLFHNRKFKEAESSFKKIVNQTSLNVTDSLMAKTYLYMAEIYDSNGNAEEYTISLEKALPYMHACGDQDKEAELREVLYEFSLSKEDVHSAVKHLEWIFHFYKEKGNKNQLQKVADLLGGLYFKIGEHEKSTELYSIAQGI